VLEILSRSCRPDEWSDLRSQAMNPINLGQRVRERREQLGLKQSELAKRVGLSRQQIGAIEAGRSYPPLPKLTALVQALELRLIFDLVAPDDATAEEILPVLSELSPNERGQIMRLVEVYRRGGLSPRERGMILGLLDAVDSPVVGDSTAVSTQHAG
jgi:transcriptional regulator with XRE-family HTH domain